MNLEEVRRQVISELDATSGEQGQAHVLAADVVLTALQRLGYRIVPAMIRVEGSAITDFQRAIAQQCALVNITCNKLHTSLDGKKRPCGNQMTYQVEEQDINGASIIQLLIADGWVIIPPQ
jgi:uncharacterized protein (DUF697 family)